VERPHALQEQDLVVSGGKLHFWKGGTGPGLLLLHSAWGDAAMSWDHVWDELTGSFTVIAPDLPGFGRSLKIAGPTLSSMAGVLKELLDALELNRVVVVGNSFGGSVARQFAGDFRETVSRLILVNGGYMPHLPALFRKLISIPIINRRVRRLMRRISFSPDALKRSFVDPAKLPPGFLEKIQENASEYSRVVFDSFMNIARPLPIPDAPTFLIWGAQDGLTPLTQAKALQRRIPGSLLISIEDAGHMPQLERPREFVMALISAGSKAG
jgi:pimeloyl-ACP methyl ester carboxylesterase